MLFSKFDNECAPVLMRETSVAHMFLDPQSLPWKGVVTRLLPDLEYGTGMSATHSRGLSLLLLLLLLVAPPFVPQPQKKR